ncbi:MAG: hypothetical protein IPL97_02505 [Niastella sp.]|nr:hypothetical protein [Niastella sp.]
MKRIIFSIATICLVTFFSYCTSSKKTTSSSAIETSKSDITYHGIVQEIITTRCAPCHIPAKGGKKLALDNYDAITKNIDEIIYRVSLSPGEKKYMPKKNPALGADSIAVLKNWAAAGFAK